MDDEMRKKILSIPHTQWKKRGFSKGSLNFMKKNAENDKPFTLNKNVKERVESVDNLTIVENIAITDKSPKYNSSK